MERTIVSHSEADQFLTCERKHWYAFGKPHPEGVNPGLEAKRQSDGLWRGTLGHDALFAYYSHLAPISRERMLTDSDIDDAQAMAQTVLTKAMLANPDRAEIVTGLMIVVNAYISHYQGEDMEYIFSAVEMEFRDDVNEDLTFPFKVDLIRQHRKTGAVEVVDHKFLANLYTGDEIAIQPQLPKYLGSLRNMGYYINGAVYDLVGHRVLKTKPYIASQSMRRIPLNATKERVSRVLKEQYRVGRQIAELKKLSPEEWEDRVNRTANSFNCKNCPFLSMCIADLNGEDTSMQVKYDYVPNSYGYSAVSNDD